MGRVECVGCNWDAHGRPPALPAPQLAGSPIRPAEAAQAAEGCLGGGCLRPAVAGDSPRPR